MYPHDFAARPRGVFISFEGAEGCGKTTQILRLAQAFRDYDRPLLALREPGGTALGESVRHLLKATTVGTSKLFPEAELLLFTASRAQLVREKILPALLAGSIVVCDRFLDSTTVYQGKARSLPHNFVEYVNQQVVSGCIPDVTFLLDIDSEVALQRVSRRDTSLNPSGIGKESLKYHALVRRGYLELAQANPDRFVVLDAEQPVDALSQIIIMTLEERYGPLS
ncbi:MAG: dTMP kinase [Candidatus Xiphinematobacter sp.]|nr:MAG: dTMP kinase [Candidatus Xiphinematobacter sp.]